MPFMNYHDFKAGAAREEEGKRKSEEGSGEEGRGLSSLPPGQTSFTNINTNTLIN